MVKFSVNSSSRASPAVVSAERAKACGRSGAQHPPTVGLPRASCPPPRKPEGHVLMETTPAARKDRLNDLGAGDGVSTQVQEGRVLWKCWWLCSFPEGKTPAYHADVGPRIILDMFLHFLSVPPSLSLYLSVPLSLFSSLSVSLCLSITPRYANLLGIVLKKNN